MLGACASQVARTRRPTSTGRPVRPRSASCVIRVLRCGQPPACFHSCVGRIRYIGLVLYDADLIEETAPQDARLVAGAAYGSSWIRSIRP